MPLLTLVSPDVPALQRKDAGFSRVCFRFAHINSVNDLVSERTGPILKSDLGSGLIFAHGLPLFLGTFQWIELGNMLLKKYKFILLSFWPNTR